MTILLLPTWRFLIVNNFDSTKNMAMDPLWVTSWVTLVYQRLVLGRSDTMLEEIWMLDKGNVVFYEYVQSNQKMHDLYATMHIFQMALPDAF